MEYFDQNRQQFFPASGVSLNPLDICQSTFIHSFIYLAIQHTNAFDKYKYIYKQQKQRLQSTKATSAA